MTRLAAQGFDGIVVVDKPEGPTSARVVAVARRILGVKKIGHTGTLDPMATGVLPLCVGRATKIAGYLLADDKTYTGEIVFGIETDTLDRMGQETARDVEGATRVIEADVVQAAQALSGDIQQVPPMFSALRKDGVRLYELARKGIEIDVPARAVRIDEFRIDSFGLNVDQMPVARFTVRCSKGTYIRSLARDIGLALGCGAHLGSLRRTEAGQFSLAGAIALAELTAENAVSSHLSLAAALTHFDRITVGEEVVGRISNGLNLRWDQLVQSGSPPSMRFCILREDGELLAIATVPAGQLVYERVFPAL